MKKLHLSDIQYCAIMQAINNAKAEIATQDFIDPYGEDADKHTNDEWMVAIKEVEALIECK